MSKIEDDVQTVFKYTNELNLPDLNLERMSQFEEGNFTKENSMDVFTDIIKMRHSNITEGRALSKFIYDYYGAVLWITKFGTSFNNLVQMYEKNEQRILVQTILKDHGFDKLKIAQPEKRELRDKFREILKWCLVGNHAITKNMNITTRMLNSTLDNLWNNLREEIIDEITYDINK